MKGFQKFSNWSYYLVLLPITLGICAWQGWGLWSWAIAPPISSNQTTNKNNDETVQIQIPSGTAAQQIGEDLEAAGLIRSAKAWRLWTLWMGFKERDSGFKSGTYALSPTQPLPVIAQKIWRGEVMQQSFTIPEGWNVDQMATYFASLGYFPAEEFIAATRQIPDDQYPWLPKDLPHLEGFLYPDTYKLASDRTTPQQVIQIMLDRFEQVALPLYQQAQSQTQFNLLEWLTFASIVEKEAVVADERELIAGVFAERLRRGMRLQTDPTVEYGLKIQQTADQPLTIAQVQTASPYNTYLNPGLPPTPIASPGLASLQAALNPQPTDYLYFVARYDGTHVFSKTLSAHNSATKAIRRQRQAQQKQSSP